MRSADILVSVSAHALCLALLFLWPAAQSAPVSKTFTVGMVELVRPRAMEPPAGAPAAAAPMAEAPAPDTSPPPAPLPKPVAAAKPTPVAVKRISPKKKPTPSTAPPSPSPERTPQPQQTAAPQEPSGAGGGVGKTAGPSHMVGGMGVYDAAVVDIPPRIIARELPQYPPGARRLHLEGTVLVSMIIDSQGNPTHCAVRKAEPKGVFEESALAAASGYRFVPGKVAGQNVATLVLVPFHFKMTN